MEIVSRFVPTPFGRFHVEECGEGPPVLFIHGGTASTREWRPVLPALGASAHCVALDRLGCGLSDRSAQGYAREVQTAGFLALAEALGFERFGVVGQSYGGFWALSLAFAVPERVSRMVLVNSAGGPRTDEERAALRARSQRDPNAPQPSIEEQIEQIERGVFADPARIPGSFRDDLRWQLEQADPTQMATSLEEMIGMASEHYDRIACPTLVIWGEVDPLLPPEMGHRLASGIPNARYIGLPGCGHVCQIECPEAFVAAVRPFLDETA